MVRLRQTHGAFRGSSAVEQCAVNALAVGSIPTLGAGRVFVNYMQCAWKVCGKVIPPGRRRRFCSINCKRKFFVDRRRKQLKELAIEYKGGKCNRCDYSRSVAALAFHHLDSAKKDFSLGDKGYTRAWNTIRTELDKCVLLCANCHAEAHEEQRKRKFPSVTI